MACANFADSEPAGAARDAAAADAAGEAGAVSGMCVSGSPRRRMDTLSGSVLRENPVVSGAVYTLATRRASARVVVAKTAA